MYDELTATAHTRALGPNPTPMHHHQAAHQREPDPQPLLGARASQVTGLHERVEDPRQHLRRDPDARIPHPQRDLIPAALGDQPDPATGFGVLGGVVQQIYQDLL